MTAPETQQPMLAWDIVLPGKRATQAWGSKPKATLLIGEDSQSTERLYIPKQVGSILNAKKKSGEIHPSCRAELLYMVGELSTTCARARIERLINQREYSRGEIKDKLQQDGYASKVIDDCIKRACDAGLISDVRYADSFIRTKIYAGWGMGRIAGELSRRGISVEELDGWPYDYLDPEDEYDRALQVAGAKCVYGSHAYEKLVRYLCGRGFALGIATRAAQQVMRQED